MSYNNNEGMEFSWDSEIKNDGAGEWTLLPEGEYPFTVTKFERSRYEGGAKLPPCPMALLTIDVDGDDRGHATVTHRLYLHSRCEGLLCDFFTSIGQRKHGEALRPRWNDVVGSTGRCKVEIHNYTKRDGGEGQSNQIKRFLEPAEPKAASSQGGWVQGQF